MWVNLIISKLLLFCFVCLFTISASATPSSSLYAQGTAKNRDRNERNDEKREDKRVSDAQREVGRKRTELEKLQADWEKKYRAFVAARVGFIKVKNQEEQTEKEAQERIGEKLGIPAQVLVVKDLGQRLRDTSEVVLQEVGKTSAPPADKVV